MPHNPFFPGTISNPVTSKINMSKRNASEVIVHKEPGLRCSLFNAVRKAGRCISLINACWLVASNLITNCSLPKMVSLFLLRLKRLYRSGLHERSEIIFRASASVKSSLLAGSWNISVSYTHLIESDIHKLKAGRS